MPPTQHSMIPDSTRPARDAYDFFRVTIAVNVGEPATTFHVNASILRTSSRFFDSILSVKTFSGKQPSIELPQYEPAAFNIYLNWLHRGELFINPPAGENAKRSEGISRESFWENLLESYFLGNKLDDSNFKDALTDAALPMLGDDEGVTWFPGRRIRQRLYERTSSGGAMRRLFVHMAASLTNVKELIHNDDPLAFRRELQRELTSGKDEDTYHIGVACAFHEHAPGTKNCYRAKKGSLL